MEPMIHKDEIQERAPKPAPRRIHKVCEQLQTGLSGQSMIWATKLAAAGLVKLELIGMEHIRACILDGRPIVFAGWHGHNFLTMCSYYKEVRHLTKGAILVPEGWNGSVMHRIGKAIELEVVQVKPGSGSTGWGRVTVSLIKLLRSGHSALLSPDGPAGPMRSVKPGICVIAKQAKAVIIPASAAATPGMLLRGRWDKHLVPLPFSKAVVCFGAPIDAAPTEASSPSTEELRERIEAALITGEQEAIRLCRAGKSRGTVQ